MTLAGALYLVSSDGEPPASRRPAAIAGGIPTYPNALVGRDTELARLDQLVFEENVRLVTVRGPGGMGKTRLVAAWAEGAARDGEAVAYAPLAPLTSSEHLATVVAVALGLTVDPKSDPGDDVLRTLQARDTVLVVDNLEHLLSDPAVTKWLQTILDQCPRVRIVVTSRERTGLAAEHLVDLGGLASVGAEGGAAPSESALLFEHRARQVQASFDLAANRAAVDAICRLLEGVPLGIELAATWVRVLGCEEILVEIKKTLDFLTADPRSGRDPRQSSMRAVFSQSWALLDDEAQRVLARLSVFRGGFDRVAAQRVAGASLAQLADVVDRSLVRARSGGTERTTRYDMHELLRQFAAEKRSEHGEADRIALAHAEHFVALAQEVHPKLRGESQIDTLAELTPDVDNLRAAIEHVLVLERWDLAAKIGWALWPFWWIRNMQREGRRWMEQVIAHVGELDLHWRTQATVAMGAMLYAQGDVAGCVRYSHELIKLSNEAGGNPRALAFAYGGFGLGAMAKGDKQAAMENLGKSRELFVEAGDPGIAAQAAAWMGTFFLVSGDLVRAKESAAAGLTEALAAGDRLANTSNRYCLARIAMAGGDLEEARDHLLESIPPSLAIDDRGNLSYVFELLGAICVAGSAFACAATMFGASDTILEAIGNRGHTYYLPDAAGLKRARKQASTALGEAAYDRGYADGRHASVDTLASLARSAQLVSGTPASATATMSAPPSSPAPSAPAPAPSPASGTPSTALEVRFFEEDDSIFIGHDYIVKGVPGRLLWRMLHIRAEEGRDEFTNRELRLDTSLKLPGFKDNLESRLILLTKRLLEKSAPIRVERAGRGRLRLVVDGPVTLSSTPARG